MLNSRPRKTVDIKTHTHTHNTITMFCCCCYYGCCCCFSGKISVNEICFIVACDINILPTEAKYGGMRPKRIYR